MTEEFELASIAEFIPTVGAAAAARAALALVRERRPPLLVLDAMMPGLHGFDVCAAVKRDPALSGTRVVFCSAVYRGTVAEDARIAFGADGCIQKRFRLREQPRRSGGRSPVPPAQRRIARRSTRRRRPGAPRSSP